jgi:sugar phosphate isomerase/epimerase
MNDTEPTRRDMLQSGAGIAVSALVGGRLLAADPPPSAAGRSEPAAAGAAPSAPLASSIRLSLAGYSFRDVLDQPGKPGKMSLKDLVSYAAGLGIEGVEPTSYYFLSTDDAFIYNLKRHAFLLGMDISGTPIRSVFNHEPGDALDAELAHVRTWVDICVKLGSPVIRIFAGKKRPEATRDQDIRLAIDGMKKACDYAGEHGIYLAIENHGYLTETADDVQRLLDGVNHPWFGVNLDTGNFVGEPYEQIARMAPHAVVCQVKSMVRDSASGQRVPADLKRIVTLLRQARYRGYVALEYEESQPFENVPRLIEQLKKCIRGTA